MSRYVVQRRWTRDARVPLSDWDFMHGWQCIPQRPTPDLDWEICDSSRDRKTRWARIVCQPIPHDKGMGSEQLSLFDCAPASAREFLISKKEHSS
jgi:hypothetical protein